MNSLTIMSVGHASVHEQSHYHVCRTDKQTVIRSFSSKFYYSFIISDKNTIREPLSWPPFLVVSVLLIVLVFCPIMCLYVLSSCCDVRYFFCIKRCSVRFYLQLFVGGLMSYLLYLCLFVHSGVHHILCCVLVLFFFVLCTICCQFLWIVHVWLSLQYSLMFIYCLW